MDFALFSLSAPMIKSLAVRPLHDARGPRNDKGDTTAGDGNCSKRVGFWLLLCCCFFVFCLAGPARPSCWKVLFLCVPIMMGSAIYFFSLARDDDVCDCGVAVRLFVCFCVFVVCVWIHILTAAFPSCSIIRVCFITCIHVHHVFSVLFLTVLYQSWIIE